MVSLGPKLRSIFASPVLSEMILETGKEKGAESSTLFVCLLKCFSVEHAGKEALGVILRVGMIVTLSTNERIDG